MRSIIIAALVAASTISLCAYAAEPAPGAKAGAPRAKPLKIGYLDLTRALKQYDKRNRLEKEIRDLQASLMTKEKSLEAGIQQLQKEMEQLALGTPERLALDEKVKQARRELEEMQQKDYQAMNAKFIETMGLLYGEVLKAAEEVAREGDYDFVLKDQTIEDAARFRADLVLQISQRNVIYFKPEYDITDIVVRKLNEKQTAEKTSAAKADESRNAAPAPAEKR